MTKQPGPGGKAKSLNLNTTLIPYHRARKVTGALGPQAPTANSCRPLPKGADRVTRTTAPVRSERRARTQLHAPRGEASGGPASAFAGPAVPQEDALPAAPRGKCQREGAQSKGEGSPGGCSQRQARASSQNRTRWGQDRAAESHLRPGRRGGVTLGGGEAARDSDSVSMEAFPPAPRRAC